MAKDILCPYCMEKLGVNSVDFLCSSCRHIVKPSKADLLLKRIPRCHNEGCKGGIANYKQCSNCKTELPPDILEYKKYLRFCLLGTFAYQYTVISLSPPDIALMENIP